jgi:hypothetical protein
MPAQVRTPKAPARVADAMIKVEELHFDPRNPRMPDATFANDDEVIEHLLSDFDVDELVQSILSSGWIDYEPFIVQKDTNIVFEGNRRLAALRLITDADLRDRVGYKLPAIGNPRVPPDRIRARFVKDHREARQFIAFKHVNGAYKWDAFAKAKYAADWLADGDDVETVSRMLGDNHNTIRRLVTGYHVLDQAVSAGFRLEDRTKKRFSFSHLYTAISRPAVREFLRMPSDDDGVEQKPVPTDGTEQLLQLMSWLYGQESKREPTVVGTQNPDLNYLVRVIENKAALDTLRKHRRLDQAYEQVEPPTSRFKDALVAANRQCENALALSTHYKGGDAQLAMVKNLAVTVRNLRDVMVKASTANTDDL